MDKFGPLMPLEAMERITKQCLCDNFDEILDRADKEDVGFVILDDESKDELVLCPARWMGYALDAGFGYVANSVLRDAIRNPSDMSDAVVAFIRKHMLILDSQTIDTAIRNIQHELDSQHVDDEDLWKKLQDELTERLKYLREQEALQKESDANA